MKDEILIYVEFLVGKSNRFYTGLCNAIEAANARDKIKLASVYPEFVRLRDLRVNDLNAFIVEAKESPLLEECFGSEIVEEALETETIPIKISDEELMRRLGW